MGRRAVVDYDSLLDRAEGDGMCLVTKEKSEKRQLNRLVERRTDFPAAGDVR